MYHAQQWKCVAFVAVLAFLSGPLSASVRISEEDLRTLSGGAIFTASDCEPAPYAAGCPGGNTCITQGAICSNCGTTGAKACVTYTSYWSVGTVIDWACAPVANTNCTGSTGTCTFGACGGPATAGAAGCGTAANCRN